MAGCSEDSVVSGAATPDLAQNETHVASGPVDGDEHVGVGE